MKYVSIDTETTGLDSENCQVLQIGAVIDCTEWTHVPVEELPSFEMCFRYDTYYGEAFGLGMNGAILMAIAEGVKRVGRPAEVWDLFDLWLTNQLGNGDKVAATGKNFASFDRPFLRRVWPKFDSRFHHRSIDPGTWFMQKNDNVPPSTALCCCRAGLPQIVAHDALADARQVCELLRVAWSIK